MSMEGKMRIINFMKSLVNIFGLIGLLCLLAFHMQRTYEREEKIHQLNLNLYDMKIELIELKKQLNINDTTIKH